MRIIDRTRTAMLSTARRWAARLPPPVGQHLSPASLALHLSPVIPGECSANMEIATPDWSLLRQSIVEMVAERGAMPVQVFTVGRALDEGAFRIIRLAHRLDCPVVVWSDGTGLDSTSAAELVDVGCSAVAVTVASLDDDVQRAVVGNSVVEATDAIVALAAARADRGAPIRLHLALPWSAGVEPEVRGVIGWANQAGVDAVTILSPVRGGQVGPLEEWTEVLRDAGVENIGVESERYLRVLSNETGGQPGIPKASSPLRARLRPCPVVGTRIAIDAKGTVFSCPFHPPMGRMTDSILTVWQKDTSHRNAVQQCTRRCRHPTLALGPRLPGRWPIGF
ncbi:MAG: hypothetical protein CL927_03860 [Deltaproteobacteria bacterium]|nr:hypothetical protein [Deltaproteobacteria bacterium]HCH61392.1 hypothetical protein [Deltaproteobacteria bacterium]